MTCCDNPALSVCSEGKIAICRECGKMEARG